MVGVVGGGWWLVVGGGWGWVVGVQVQEKGRDQNGGWSVVVRKRKEWKEEKRAEDGCKV